MRFSALKQEVNAYCQGCKRGHLSLRQVAAMDAVGEGSMQVGDIAFAVGVTQQAAGKLLKDLEMRRHNSLMVSRKPKGDEGDSRKRIYSLTKAGLALLNGMDE